MSFQDIKGHDNIVHFFKRALETKRVSHSYLFFGPDGVGKNFMAATLAKAMNCLDMKSDSCDKCTSCVKIDNKNHPDIMWLEVNEKRDVISIEQIRELERQINLKPYEARTKVFIIQDSHLMSEAAANCLLKTLEEPPKNSVIILITSKVEEQLPTAKSRCIHIKFEPLKLDVRIELAKDKGFLKEEALFLSRLERADLPLSAGVKGGEIFDYKNRILKEFGSDKNLLDEHSFVFNESKEGMKYIISILGSWFRDIFVLKTGAATSLVINLDRMDELKRLIDRFSFEELENILKELQDTQFYIERNVGPKLALNNLKMKFKHGLNGLKDTD